MYDLFEGGGKGIRAIYIIHILEWEIQMNNNFDVYPF